MAKKRKRRRTSLLTKGINVGILLLAFSRPLRMLLEGNAVNIPHEATGRLTQGAKKLDTDLLLGFYGPMVAAVVLKKAISMVRRTARV